MNSVEGTMCKTEKNDILNYSDYYSLYMNKLKEYYEKRNDYQSISEELTKTEREYIALKKEKEDISYSLKSATDNMLRCNERLKTNVEEYNRNIQRRTKQIEEEINRFEFSQREPFINGTKSFGEFTDQRKYNKAIELINRRYDHEKTEYEVIKHGVYAQNIAKLETKKTELHDNKEVMVQKALSKYRIHLEEKKKDIDRYLNMESVKKYDLAQEVLMDLKTSKVSESSQIPNSLDDLYKKCSELKNVSSLIRFAENSKQKAYSYYAEKYVSDHPIVPLILGTIASYAALILFLCVFPIDKFFPSVVAITGCLIAIIIYKIIQMRDEYFFDVGDVIRFFVDDADENISAMVDLIKLKRISKLQLCILVFLNIIGIALAIMRIAYFDYLPNFFLTGLVAYISFLLGKMIYYLCRVYPINMLFYKSDRDIENDLKGFAINYYAKKSVYNMLYNIEDTTAFIMEKEINDQIEKEKQAMRFIFTEPEYVQLEENRESEIDKLYAEKMYQESKKERILKDIEDTITNKRLELESIEDNRIRTVKTLHERIKAESEASKAKYRIELQKMQDINERYSACERKLNELKAETNHINKIHKSTIDYLKEATQNMTSIGFRLDAIKKMSTPKGIESVNGILGNKLYFVSEKLSRDGFAHISEIPLRCRPTICIYDKKELNTSNLSNELASFIIWFGETLERTNPIPLFDNRRINVIDLDSGAELFRDSRLPDYVGIATNEGLSVFTQHIEDQMNLLRISCEEQYIETDITKINMIKAVINKNTSQYIEKVEDLTEPYCTYSIAFFILPNETKEYSSNAANVLNESLRRYYQNCEKYGLLPIFIVDKDSWENSSPSSTVKYLRDVHQKQDIRYIAGIGSENTKNLRIALSPDIMSC